MTKDRALVSQFRGSQADVIDGLGPLTVSRETLQKASAALNNASIKGPRMGAMTRARPRHAEPVADPD